tara:strand:- start:530 stop:1183 length:654 start_codon:yes stop_codon:yes gene_type:complete
MEAIEQELEAKGIEKSEPVIEEKKEEVKPRKPRSQAQKDAFEKARKKRAENLAKKKLEEAEKEVSIDTSNNQIQEVPAEEEKLALSAEPQKPKKKRGRPRGSKSKLKKEPVPEPGTPNFLPPHQPPPPGDLRYQYQPHHSQFNPWMAYQPPPQVHNYYYGHQQGAVNQAPPPGAEPIVAPDPQLSEPEPETAWSSESEEDEKDYLPPPDPRLKFRFA